MWQKTSEETICSLLEELIPLGVHRTQQNTHTLKHSKRLLKYLVTCSEPKWTEIRLVKEVKAPFCYNPSSHSLSILLLLLILLPASVGGCCRKNNVINPKYHKCALYGLFIELLVWLVVINPAPQSFANERSPACSTTTAKASTAATTDDADHH